jgi:ribonuclease BN (tRNA processing enzyme)
MKLRILGGHGGKSKGHSTTSYLIDETLLIDAGGVAAALAVEDQVRISDILISHVHLDHIKDLAFLCDNCFGLKADPFRVHTHPTVAGHIQRHLLNDVLWPDFTRLPTAERPTIVFEHRLPGEPFQLGSFEVTPMSVNHPHDAMGFLVKRGDTSVLMTLDTGPTDAIWELGRRTSGLGAIITEVSFPNALQGVADLSHHHTPQSLKQEIPKMPPGVPIILTHLKPAHREQIMRELAQLNEPRIRVLEHDGIEIAL